MYNNNNIFTRFRDNNFVFFFLPLLIRLPRSHILWAFIDYRTILFFGIVIRGTLKRRLPRDAHTHTHSILLSALYSVISQWDLVSSCNSYLDVRARARARCGGLITLPRYNMGFRFIDTYRTRRIPMRVCVCVCINTEETGESITKIQWPAINPTRKNALSLFQFFFFFSFSF